MKKKSIFLKIAFLLTYSFNFAFTQSAQEIEQVKKVIKRTGMNEAQVRSLAKGQGYTEEQINSAIKKEKEKKPNVSEEINYSEESNEIAESVNEENLEGKNEVEKIQAMKAPPNDGTGLSYYGYDIFFGNPELFQSSAIGAVGPDYLIGPGDEIIVMLWGETQFRQQLKVDKEGFIFFPDIGQIFVNGLSLSLLESKLFRILSQSYNSLNPQGRKPTTFLDISLGNLRPLRIQVLGEVKQPGAYTVNPSTTLFTSLYYFNGPTELGSLRDIRLIRDEKEITKIDFYDYLLTGKMPDDEKLQLDDIIFIPNRLKSITIKGEVNRPGIYELKPGETLLDIIKMAGELKITAYLDRAQIDRVVPFKDRKKTGMDRIVHDVNLEKILNKDNSFALHDGDEIEIFSIMNARNNIIEISGSILRPGSYELGDSLYLVDLINKSGGLLGDAYLERIDLTRLYPDYSKELIKLNLKKAFNGDINHNIQLRSLDQIKVYGLNEMIPESFVEISGHVKDPGRYLLKKNMTIYDLVFISGGFLDEEFKKATYLKRADLIRFNLNNINKTIIPFNLNNILENQKSEDNQILKSGDKVVIYSKDIFNKMPYVTVLGSIKKPGQYELTTNMGIGDLFMQAGGISKDVYNYKIEIARVDPDNLNDFNYASTIELGMLNEFLLLDEHNNSAKHFNDESMNQNFKLEPYDHITIHPDPNFQLQKIISVGGAVYYPGNYVIKNPNESITDIVSRAGGLRPNAYPVASTFTRQGQVVKIDLNQILDKPKSEVNLKVQDGDQIFVAKQPKMSQVLGEVNAPGTYTFLPGKRVKYYINMAGGYSQDAEKDDVWITYPNGKSKAYKTYLSNPKVLDGSIITIGRKKDTEPFDLTQFASEVTNILADFLQIVIIILTLQQTLST